MVSSRVDLWWLPLGAGGHFVRMNGRIYEWVRARRDGRRPQELYHAALEVHLDGARFIIENSWPIPDAVPSSRGVVVEGPVFHPLLARSRFLRYEIRCWRDGCIADAAWAVASPQRVSTDARDASKLIDLVPCVPVRVWGRRARGDAEMWNSNSVISWLLAASGLPAARVELPPGGRAPGWDAGVAAARSDPVSFP